MPPISSAPARETEAEKAGWTPGPWTVTGISMTTGNVSIGMKEHRIVIAEVTNAASFGDMLIGAMKRGGGRFDHGDCRTQHANASLIAAAPETHEALQRARDIFQLTLFEIGATGANHDLKHPLRPTWERLQREIKEADRALAKATGAQS